jgi:serine/threonine-protein kinase HipA
MVTTAFVKIWGETVGAVAWDPEQQLGIFEYDKAFIRHGWDLAPIKMPIRQGARIYSFPELRTPYQKEFDTFKGLPGLLADSLPDKYGNQLINLWLAQQGRAENSMNPVEQLCFMGVRGLGALEFEPQYRTEAAGSERIEMDNLVGIAAKMLNKRTDFKTTLLKNEEEAIKKLITIGTSAGGARPKAVIAYNEQSGEVRSGQSEVPEGFTHWIIKLDGVSDVQLGDSLGYGRVEMAYYRMATDAGIEMMPSRLLEENGRAHFMTRRFDRDTGPVKHHIQTFCALKHYDFNEVNSFSYEQLFQCMRELRLSYPEAEQLFRRMVFNVLSRNCDDHTKNFSFRLKKGERWELTPAYDLCYAYRPDSVWVSQHALSVNGKRNHIGREDLLAVAQSMHIKKAEKIIDEVNEVVREWESYAKEVGVDEEKKRLIGENLAVLN